MRRKIRGILSLLLTAVLFFGSVPTVVLAEGQTVSENVLTIEPEKEAIEARVDDNYKAFIPLMDGKIIELPGKVFAAYLAPDHKTIVALSPTGDLSICSVSNTKMRSITRNVAALARPTTKNFIYRDKSGSIYRYTFETQQTLKLGSLNSADISDNGEIVYATDGKIYFLAANASSAKKIADYSGYILSMALSTDGKVVAWLDEKGGEADYYFYMNGQVEKVDVLTKTNSIIAAEPRIDLISNMDSSASIIAVPNYMLFGGNPRLHLPLYIQSNKKNERVGTLYLERYYMYTKDGPFENNTEDSGIYAVVNDYEQPEDKSFLVKIYNTGEYDIIRKNVRLFCIDDGIIYFTDEDNQLFYGTLTENGILNEKKITNDVKQLIMPTNGQYAVYTSSSIEKGYVLGLIERNGKISMIDKFVTDAVWLSMDGTKIYYLATMEETDIFHADLTYGKLMEYDFSTNEIKTIDENVIADSLNSGISTGVDPNGFMYEKFIENIGSNVYADWVFYDGKAGEILAQRVNHPLNFY